MTDDAVTTSVGRLFHTRGAAALNARLPVPIVQSRVRRTTSFWVVVDRNSLAVVELNAEVVYAACDMKNKMEFLQLINKEHANLHFVSWSLICYRVWIWNARQLPIEIHVGPYIDAVK